VFPSRASKPDVEAIVRTGVAAAAMPPEDGAGAGAVDRTAGRDGWRVAAEEDRRPKASERLHFQREDAKAGNYEQLRSFLLTAKIGGRHWCYDRRADQLRGTDHGAICHPLHHRSVPQDVEDAPRAAPHHAAGPCCIVRARACLLPVPSKRDIYVSDRERRLY
jgi:hypothetical protein